ncbi:Ig-like domain-containing protein [Tenacibaculum ovolyticum]|uniref:Ig-like domain-containing protein n=1 Tax=Tenacibaculum ovolyticum TaxID=104270 RepID=UPI0022F38402|nr:Ig-like domain-containing protein [Tenacibaculum ovolyticum]WBX75623.1 Ig-like domain-containing protein [Tenacibaculum ovolyticum]
MKRNYNFVKLNKSLSSNRLFLALLFFTVFTCFSYAQTCTTESWSGSTAIPDGFSLASETVNFSTSGSITDVNVTLNITHGYVGDLYIRLTSPNGTFIGLSTYRGSFGNNYTNTIFDDSAANPISSGTAPFAGTFRPEAALSNFIGENPTGNWTLSVFDINGGDVGTIDSFSIEICTSNPCTDNASIDGTPTTSDSDGDGINNVCDLDDDNDGILDINELAPCNTSNSTLNWDGEYAKGDGTYASGEDPIINPNLTINGTGVRLTRDGGGLSTQEFNVNDAVTTNSSYTLYQKAANAGESTHIFEFDEPIYNLAFTVYDLDNASGNTTFIDEVEFVITKVDGTIHTLSASEYTLNGQSVVGNTFTGTAASNNRDVVINGIQAWITKIELKYKNLTTAPSAGQYQVLALGNFTFCNTQLDTDNDGTPDYLDSDSDNDGCYDALEGSNTGLTLASIDSNGRLIGGVDNKSGIPISVGTGQTNVSSTNSSITGGECDDDGDGVLNKDDKCEGFDDAADADGDSIPDGCDLDDDNDGILDTVENSCANSISYEFYDLVPSGFSVDNIPTTGALSVGTATSFDVDALFASIPSPADTFSIRYKGLLLISTAGSYTFFTRSDDGSKLHIDGNEIVDNDGLHGSVEQSGQVNLGVGYHQIEVTFFENFGAESLQVQYQGPSITKQNIPFTQLSCLVDTDKDGIPDYLDTDSDNDGCPDSVESGGTDVAKDGILDGIGFDSSGRVTGGTGGYNGANGTEIISDVISNVAVTPDPASVCEGNSITLTAIPSGLRVTNFGTTGATGDDTTITIPSGDYVYKWYLGTSTTPLTNVAPYSGTSSASLVITNATIGLSGNNYRVEVTSTNNSCLEEGTVTLTVNSVPAPSVGTVTQPTCGVATGSFQITGFDSGDTYVFSPAIASANISATGLVTAVAGTTYSFTVTDTDGSGCTSAASSNIVVSAQPVTPSAPSVGTVTQPTCGVATGSFQITGFDSGDTYVFSPAIGSANISATGLVTAVAGTTYSFTVTDTDGSGCTSAASSNIVVSAQPVTPSAPSVGTVTQPTCGVATGSFQITGFDSGDTYVFSPAIASANISATGLVTAVAGTTYSFTVTDTDGSGCTSAASSNIVVSAQPVTPSAPSVGTVTQPTCGVATGSFQITGFDSGDTYVFSPAIASANISATGLVTAVAGTTYSFTVTDTDGSGCTSAASSNIVVSAQPVTPSAPSVGTVTQPTCGVATGSFQITGFDSGDTYVFSPAIASANISATGLVTAVAGTTYSFTVTDTDGSGCTSAASSNIVVSAQPVTPSAPSVGTVTQPTCGVATGSFQITGFDSGDTYVFSPAIGSANISATGLVTAVAGTTYSFTVTDTDGSGCTSAASSNIVVSAQLVTPSAPSVGTVTQPTCGVATGSFQITGFDSGDTYVFSPAIGSANISATGLVTAVAGTTYSFTVTDTDGSGCTSAASSNIVVSAQLVTPSAPSVGTVTQPTCGVATGSFQITGFDSGDTYVFSPAIGSANISATGLVTAVAGTTYSFTVTDTDGSGCTSAASSNIVVSAQLVTPSAPSVGTVTQPTCGVATGSFQITGFDSGDTYVFSPAIGSANISATGLVTAVAGTTYSFTVTDTDGSGCTSAASSNIVVSAQPVTPSAPSVGTVTQPTCGVATGSFQITGFDSGDTYVFSPAIGSANISATGLVTAVAGTTYSFTVTDTDGSGCTSAASSNIVVSAQPVTLSAPSVGTVTQPTCGVATGSFQITGFDSGDTYVFSPAIASANISATGLVTAVAGTTYSFTVTDTDGSGCTSAASSNIVVSAQPVTPSAPSVGTVTQPTCGVATGSFQITGFDSGDTYVFSPAIASANISATGLVTAVAGTTYSFTVTDTDGSGCTSAASSNIVVSAQPVTLSAPSVGTVTQPTCGVATGSFQITGFDSGDTYVFSPAIASANISATGLVTAVAGTTYSFTVTDTDGSGCTSAASSNIVVSAQPVTPSAPSVGTVTQPTCGVATGSFQITGFDSGDTYVFSPAIASANISATGLVTAVAGTTYSFTVTDTDGSGCTSAASSNIVVSAQPVTPSAPSVGTVTQPTCGVATGSFQITGFDSGDTYVFSPAIGSANISATGLVTAVAGTTYSFTVTDTDGSGCTSAASSNIVVSAQLVTPSAPSVGTVTQPTCGVATGSFQITGFDSGDTYVFSPAIGSANISATGLVTAVAGTTYSFTVTDTDGSGCTSAASSNIVVSAQLVTPSAPSVGTVTQPTCGVATGSFQITGFDSGDTYVFSPAIGSANISATGLVTAVAGTTYSFTVTDTDGSGCTSAASSNIVVSAQPVTPSAPSVGTVTQPTCGVATGSFQITGFDSGDTYVFSPAIGSANISATGLVTAVAGTTYSFTVTDTDGSGCTSAASSNIVVSAQPVTPSAPSVGTVTQPTCGVATGSFQITGFDSGDTYVFSPAIASANISATGLVTAVAGTTYSFTVTDTDGSGCTSAASSNIVVSAQPVTLSAPSVGTVTQPTCGVATGSFQITGFDSGDTYVFSPAIASANISATGLVTAVAGTTYSFTVTDTDGSGCTSAASSNIVVSAQPVTPSAPSVGTVTQPTCGVATGSFQITGFDSGDTYVFSPAIASANISATGLVTAVAGTTYSFTVTDTDGSGCTSAASSNIVVSAQPVTPSAPSVGTVTQPTCGVATGSFQITGFDSGDTYVFSPAIGSANISATGLVTAVAGTTYSFTVTDTDGSGCTSAASSNIVVSAQLVTPSAPSVGTVTQPTCGVATGSFQITGFDSGDTYVFSPAIASANISATGLVTAVAGTTYSFTVTDTDGSGCTSAASSNIVVSAQPVTPSAPSVGTVTQPTCGVATGSFQITGFDSGDTYVFSPAIASANISATGLVTAVAGTTYSFTVTDTDGSGCTSAASSNIVVSAQPVTPSAPSVGTVTQPTCGVATGSFQITGFDSGDTYVFSPAIASANISATGLVTAVAGTTYSFTVTDTDGSGCTSAASSNIVVSAQPVTPSAPSVGTVTQPTCGVATGSFQITGFDSGDTYVFSPAIGSANISATGLVTAVAGTTYSFTVTDTDGSGCTSAASSNIVVSAQPVTPSAPSVGTVTQPTCGVATGSFQITGFDSGDTYVFSPAIGSANISATGLVTAVAGTTYSFTVTDTDGSGCTSAASSNIVVSAQPVTPSAPSVGTVTQPTCGVATGSFQITGFDSGDTYVFSPAIASANISATGLVTAVAGTTYSFTVTDTDGSGCTSAASSNIVVSAQPVTPSAPSVGTVTQPTCGVATGSFQITGFDSGDTYVFSPAIASANISATGLVTAVAGTTYSFTVTDTDGSGCTSAASSNIVVSAQPVTPSAPSVGTVTQPTCGVATGSFQITGFDSGDTYVFSPAIGSANISATGLVTAVAGTTYSFTVTDTDGSGCTSAASSNIVVSAQPVTLSAPSVGTVTQPTCGVATGSFQITGFDSGDTYVFSPAIGSANISATGLVTAVAGTTYSFTVTDTDGSGCTSAASSNIVVSAQPVTLSAPSVGTVTQPTCGVATGSFQITGFDSGDTYVFSPAIASANISATGLVTAVAGTTYSFTVTDTDGSGCTSAASSNIVVSAQPVTPSAPSVGTVTQPTCGVATGSFQITGFDSGDTYVFSPAIASANISATGLVTAVAGTTYSFTVTDTDGSGCTSAASSNIVVSAQPVTPSAPSVGTVTQPTCGVATGSFQITGFDSGDTYVFSPAIASANISATGLVTAVAGTTYSFTVTDTDGSGCTSAASSNIVVSAQPVTPSAPSVGTVTQPTCGVATGSFQITGFDSGDTYVFSPAIASANISATGLVTAVAGTTYSFTVTDTDGSGCTSAASSNIVVSAQPVTLSAPSVGTVTQPTCGVATGSFQITGFDSGDTYVFSPAIASANISATGLVTAVAGTTYSFTVTDTDGSGCTSAASSNIVVSAQLVTPSAPSVGTVTQPTCGVATGSFQITGFDSGDTYVFSPAIGSANISATGLVTAVAGTTYSFTVTDTDGSGCTSAASSNIVVSAQPVTPSAPSVGTVTQPTCGVATGSFQITGFDSGDTYVFSPAIGSANISATGLVTAVAGTTYSFTVTDTDGSGCTSAASSNIVVSAQPVTPSAPSVGTVTQPTCGVATGSFQITGFDSGDTYVFSPAIASANISATGLVTAVAGTTYSFTVTDTDGSGCTSAASSNIVVSAQPVTLSAPSVGTVTQPTCGVATGSFQITGFDSGDTYVFSPAIASANISATGLVTAVAGTTYSFTVTDTDGSGCTSAASSNIVVSAQPVTPSAPSVGTVTQPTCGVATGSFQITGFDSGDTYVFSPAIGSANISATGLVTAVAGTTYSFTVTDTDGSGCTSAASSNIVVSAQLVTPSAPSVGTVTQPTCGVATGSFQITGFDSGDTYVFSPAIASANISATGLVTAVAGTTYSFTVTDTDGSGCTSAASSNIVVSAQPVTPSAPSVGTVTQPTCGVATGSFQITGFDSGDTYVFSPAIASANISATGLVTAVAGTTYSFTVTDTDGSGCTSAASSNIVVSAQPVTPSAPSVGTVTQPTCGVATGSFQITGFDSGDTYVFSPAIGSANISATGLVTAVAGTTYSFTVTDTDGSGCTSAASSNIVVSAQLVTPSAPSVGTVTQPTCGVATGSFQITGFDSGDTYVFSPAIGSANISATGLVTAVAGTTYSFTVTDTDGSGCTSAASSNIVVSAQLVTPSAPSVGTVTQPTCGVATGSFQITGFDSGDTYVFSPAIGSANISATGLVTAVAGTTYSFTVTDTDGSGCTSAASSNIVVSAQLVTPSAPSVGTVTQPTCGVATGSFQITGFDSGDTYVFSPAIGSANISATGLVTAVAGTTYSFTVTDTDGSGCTSAASSNIVVSAQPVTPSAPSVGTVTQPTCGVATGSFQITGFDSGDTYVFSPAIGSANISATGLVTAVAGTTYSFTVTDTDGSGCTSAASSNIVVSAQPVTPSAPSVGTVTQPTCGVATGSFQITGFDSGDTYVFSPAIASANISATGLVTAVAGTTYSFTVTDTDGSGCTSAASSNIVVSAQPVTPSAPSVGTVTQPTCGVATGSFQITGFDSGDTYVFSPAIGSANISATGLVTAVAGTTYSFTVTDTDGSGCTSAASSNIVVSAQPVTPSAPSVGTVTQPTCGVATGSFQITGFDSGDTYVFSPAIASANISATGLVTAVAGTTYSFTVTDTDGSGCTSAASSNIVVSAQPVTPSAPSVGTVTQPTCGVATGSFQITGFDSGDTYVFSPAIASANISATGLVTAVAGTTYSFTVTDTDGSGCTSAASSNIVVSAQPVTPSAPSVGTVTQPTCGVATGSFQITGFDSGDTYVFSPAIGSANISATGLVTAVAGTTYSFTVTDTDGSGCTSAASSNIVVSAQPVTPSAPSVGTVTQPTCGVATGSFQITGFDSGDTYVFSPAIGSANISATGLVTAVAGTTYSFTVTDTDGSGCTSAASSNIVVSAQLVTPSAPSVGTVTQPTCGVATGSFQITGFDSGDTYVFSPAIGSANISATGLVTAVAGTTYSFTVTDTDGSGCTSAASSNIVVSAQLVTPSAPSVGTVTQPTCGVATGSFQITGFDSGDTYVFSPAIGSANISATGLVTAVAGTTYSFTVTDTDGSGCTSAASSNIVVSAQLVTPSAPSVGTVTQPTCGVATGSFQITGFDSGDTYVFSPAIGSANISATGLVTAVAGTTYSFTVTDTDGSGCTSAASSNIVVSAQPVTPSAPSVGTVTQPTCGVATGSFQITGFDSGDTYVFSPAIESANISATGLVTAVAGTTYSFTVTDTDGSGCTSAASSNIVVSAQPVTPSAPSVGTVTQPTCGVATGSFQITGFDSGDTYVFSPAIASANISATGLVTAVAGTTYSFTVTDTDGSGCTSAASSNIVVSAQPVTPSAPSVGTVTQPTCGVATGSFQITGFDSGDTYVFSPAIGSANISATGLVTAVAGTTYSFTVTDTDGSGCTSAASSNIVVSAQPVTPSAPSVGTVTQPTCGVATGSFQITGFDSGDTYVFSPAIASANISATGLVTAVAGTTYSFTVTDTDGSGCTSAASSNIVVSAQPVTPSAPSVGTVTQPTCGVATGSFQITGFDSGDTYVFSPAIASANISATGLVTAVAGTTYSFTVTDTDGSGCTSAASSNIVVSAQPVTPSAPSVGTVTQPTCGVATGSFQITGFDSGDTYVFSPAIGSANISATGLVTAVAGTTYSFTVTDTDGSGCTSAASSNIVVSAQPVTPSAPSVGTVTQPTCGVATGSFQITGFDSGDTYVFSPAIGSANISATGLVTAVAGTTYSFTVTDTDGSGCTSAASSNIVVSAQPVTLSAPSVGTVTQPTCGVATGSFQITGFDSGDTYVFSPAIGSANISATGLVTAVAGTTYSFTVTDTDGSGCTSAASSNIVVSAQPVTPSAPSVGTVTQPTCGVATGSFQITGFDSGDTYVFSPAIASANISATGLVTAVAGTTYSFTVTDTDGSGCTSAASSNIVVSAGNCTNAIADIITTYTDIAVNGNVLTNDEDIEGDSQLITSNTDPSNGMLIISSTGDYTYTPNPGFTGEDSFTYTICDNGTPQACDTATVTITVLPVTDPTVNDAPVANNDTGTTEVDTPVNGNLTSNDFDSNGDLITINTIPVTNPTNGTVVINVDGTYVYTPTSGFIGVDTFEYEICDNGTPSLCDTAVVTINVNADNGLNDTYANDDAFNGNINTVIGGDLLLNDTDPEGDDQIINTTAIADPTNGVVTINADGTFTYTPNTDYVGPDSFVYEICDNAAVPVCDQATVYLTVNDTNTTEAVADIVITYMDAVVSGNVLTNDEDKEGDTQTVTSNTDPTNGVVTVKADGSYVYVPFKDFVGNDSFTYTVCDDGTPQACDTTTVTITVLPVTDPAVNDAPVANNDTGTTEVNTPVNGNLTANDFDLNGNLITINTIPVTNPTNGTVIINADGTYTYTPTSGFIGVDTFEYEICDNGTPSLCDTAVVTINVNSNNGLNDTYANDDAFNGNINTVIGGDLLLNDTDPEGNDQIINTIPVIGATNGVVTINADGTFTYTPNTDYAGPDSFVYEICDNGAVPVCDQATVYLTVNNINTTEAVADIVTTYAAAEVSGNVLTNDEDKEGDGQTVTSNTNPTDGVLTINADGSYVYTPAKDFVGNDSFTYTICDDGTPQSCDTATVTITVLPVIGTEENDAPVANNDTGTTEADIPVNGNLIANDFDLNGDLITINTTPVTNPTNGTVIINADGTYTYTPTPGFIGVDTFEYEICDNGTPSLCDTAIVTINVNADNGLNDTYANDDVFNGNINTVIGGDLLLNDTDPEGDDQIINTTAITDPTNGVVTINADGTFTYTPNTGYVGPDSFVYEICDNATVPVCDQATVYLTVNNINSLDTCVVVYNEFTPNGDGINDELKIDCIEKFKNNKVEIFNRWGNTVFKISGYNNEDKVFKGISNGRANFNVDDELPVGTYFYILDLGNGTAIRKGWIYINR